MRGDFYPMGCQPLRGPAWGAPTGTRRPRSPILLTAPSALSPETATELAALRPAKIIVVGGPDAIIATADTFADALAAAPVSYAAHRPILLVGTIAPGTPTVLPVETAAALTSLHITQAVILGGAYAVPTHVEEQIDALGAATLVRLAGADRTVT